MKVQDSGMPKEEMWSKFFEPEKFLQIMGLTTDLQTVVDLGCGFGTFSIPASQMIKGKVHAFDIDPDMIAQLQTKVDALNIKNIELLQADFISEGTGMLDNSVDYVMLFNILHHDNPFQILKEVHRIMKVGATAGIIHWRSDINTPRGPKLDIRPKPDQIKQWAIQSGFSVQFETLLEPYHFGIIINKF